MNMAVYVNEENIIKTLTSESNVIDIMLCNNSVSGIITNTSTLAITWNTSTAKFYPWKYGKVPKQIFWIGTLNKFTLNTKYKTGGYPFNSYHRGVVNRNDSGSISAGILLEDLMADGEPYYEPEATCTINNDGVTISAIRKLPSKTVSTGVTSTGVAIYIIAIYD